MPLRSASAESVVADREAFPLSAREAQTTAAESLAEHPVLLAEVVDGILLTTVQESCEDRDGEREGRAWDGAWTERTSLQRAVASLYTGSR
jgi:hypothetical protein